MSDIKTYNPRNLPEVRDYIEIKNIDPADVDFSLIRRTASAIQKYLKTKTKDPHTICVKARGAMNSVSECLQIVDKIYAYYHTEAKKQYSIAKLERADEWFEKNKPNIKLTDGLRSTYAEMDDEYQEAKRREYAAKSLQAYLKNKHGDFLEDLNIAKKSMSIDSDEEANAHFDNMDEEEFE